MTGLSHDEGKKPQSRHIRSQSLQEPTCKAAVANAKVWATIDLFSPADTSSTSHPVRPGATDDSPVLLRGNVRRMRSSASLMCESGDVIRDLCSNSGRCRPFGIFSGIFSDFSACVVPRYSSESKRSWTKSRAKALLELSKRQQSALVDKQDAIDLLEWKLRKLQAINAKGRETNSPSTAHGTLNIMDDTCSESSGSISSPSLSDSSSAESSTAASLSTSCAASDHQPALADLCRNAKTSFSEDSWKVEEKRDSIHFPGFQDMTTSDKVPLFEMAATRARVAARYFCKVFMKQMENSGYSVCRTLAATDPSAKFLKREHTSFVLEANLNKALYHCFENDSFDDTGLTLIIDPKERCAARFEEFKRMRLVDSVDAANTIHADFEPTFLAFCEQKMREIWFLFPWNIVFRDTEERKNFTGAFLDAAKCIWLLHRLASSLYPAAIIMRVGKGMEINPQYVERMSSSETVCSKCHEAKVQFMVAPGFQVHQKVIKCQVYEHLLCD